MFSTLHGHNMQRPEPVCMLLNECLPLFLFGCPALSDDTDSEGGCFLCFFLFHFCVSCCEMKCADTMTWLISAAGTGSGFSGVVSLIHCILMACLVFSFYLLFFTLFMLLKCVAIMNLFVSQLIKVHMSSLSKVNGSWSCTVCMSPWQRL